MMETLHTFLHIWGSILGTFLMMVGKSIEVMGLGIKWIGDRLITWAIYY